jgi:hypothetical protein
MPEPERARPQQAGRIKDARGRTVSQLEPVTMHLLRRPGIIPPEVLKDIAQEVGIGMTRATKAAFWSSLLGLACLIIALAILITRLHSGTIGTRRFVMSILPYCGIWVAPFSLWMGARNARHPRITGVMLAHRRCPHCGYDLRLLPTDPADGATVCPECGCAWKLDESSTDGVRADA